MLFFFFQAEDGIRDLVRSRGLGDVYKRQFSGRADDDDAVCALRSMKIHEGLEPREIKTAIFPHGGNNGDNRTCLLYTSDAADERSSVDLGGRRIIKKKKNK